MDIAALVRKLENLSGQIDTAHRAIEKWLLHEWQLANLPRTLRDTSSLEVDDFITAVRTALPKKRKLTAGEIGELGREHAATIEPARQARAESFATERKLSDLVNEAYGLTAAEVELMWHTAPPRMPFTPAGLTAVDGGPPEDDADET